MKFSPDPLLVNLPIPLREDAHRYCKGLSDEDLDSLMAAPAPLPEQLMRVLALSDFVGQSLVRRPGLLASLLDSADLSGPYPAGSFRTRLRQLLAEASGGGQFGEEQLGRLLRVFRRREMVRIAWRDLTGAVSLENTMAEISELAQVCLDEALILLHAWLGRELGMVSDNARPIPDLVVFAMGKLGSSELNFSSDIDLIFGFCQPGRLDHGELPITSQEYFSKLARRLIKVIGSQTADGFVFRVDMRLRPLGDSGPLVMSLDGLEDYYQGFGQEWERFAWAKARPVAGDCDGGERLLASLQPFIYRRHLDYNTFDSLRDIKKRLAAQVSRKRLFENIKLGAGGIREIEFIAQVFQLLYGARLPRLRGRAVLPVFNLLAETGLLAPRRCQELEAAYRFLRLTEHHLQEFSDQHTHDLPRDALGRLRLAVSAGFAAWPDFSAALQAHLHRVHAIFTEIFEPAADHGQPRPATSALAEVWETADPRAMVEQLAQAGFDRPEEAASLLRHLRDHGRQGFISDSGRRHLNRLLPLVLEELRQDPGPTTTLGRVLKLIRAVTGRPSYLALLNENPTALSHLIRLCRASPWVATLVARYPVLLDELLDPRTLYHPSDQATLAAELRARLHGIDPRDEESALDELRRCKQASILRVAAADIAGGLPLPAVSDHLTAVAETMVREVLTMAWSHVAARHGLPRLTPALAAANSGFLVVALGKFGGLELGYGSDLDIIFLHGGEPGSMTSGTRPVDSTIFFSRLAQRILHILTAHTSFGTLYPVDTRLRPGGEAGILVSQINAFAEYQNQEAWTWEHQALIRARPVAGDPALAAAFRAIRGQVLTRARDPETLRRDIVAMRRRMLAERRRPVPELFDLKADPGGLIDIEFLTQYGVLREAARHPQLLDQTATIKLLAGLAVTGLLTTREAELLAAAYLALRAEVHRLGLQEEPALVGGRALQWERQQVRTIWEKLLGESL